MDFSLYDSRLGEGGGATSGLAIWMFLEVFENDFISLDLLKFSICFCVSNLRNSSDQSDQST